MDKNDKFELVYKKIVEDNAAEFENYKGKIEEQNKIKNKYKSIVSIIGIIGTLMMISLVWFKMENNILLLLMVLILVIVFVLVFSISLYGYNKMGPPIIRTFRDKFKNQAINTLIKSIDEFLEYEPNNSIPQEIYERAEFNTFEKYFSEDLIYGKTENECNFEMAQVSTWVNADDRVYTIFQGIFAVIETPKPFNEVIYIRGNNEKVKFSNLKIELDSTEFEKFFDVYSSDNITTMQILTSDIMQKLVEFLKKSSIPYEITIKENCIYIAFSCGKVFEPPTNIFYLPKTLEQSDLKQFALNKSDLYRYYEILDFTIEFTNLLTQMLDDTPY